VLSLRGAGGNAGGAGQSVSRGSFSRHGRWWLWSPLIPLETSWFLVIGDPYSGPPISRRNRATPKRPALPSVWAFDLPAHTGLVHSPPSSVGAVAHPGPAKMAHSPTAINTPVRLQGRTVRRGLPSELVCHRPSCSLLPSLIPCSVSEMDALVSTSVRADQPLYPRGPRSGPGYAVPVHPHLIGPIRPTRRHIPTSPPRGLYEMPSLCIFAYA